MWLLAYIIFSKNITKYNQVGDYIVKLSTSTLEQDTLLNDEYYYSIIRKNIRKYRKQKKLTQQELADLTDISREYICDIENESRNKHITIALLGRISEALNIDITNFFK